MRSALMLAVRWWALAGGVMLLVIVAVTSANVGGFVLDAVATPWGWDVPGLPGYEDVVTLAISAAALMFFPYCQQCRGHVVVALFASRFPVPLRRALDAFWLAATAGTAAFLAYWMTVGMIERRQDGALSRVLGVPEWPFFLPGIVSLVLWGLVATLQIAADRPGAGGDG